MNSRHYLYSNMLVCTYVHTSRFKGQFVHACHLQIQSKQGRATGSIRPSTQVSSYGLDPTMNLDTLRVQHYKEVRKKKVNSYCDCSKPSQADEDRNKQGAIDCSASKECRTTASLDSKQNARKLHRKSLTEGRRAQHRLS